MPRELKKKEKKTSRYVLRIKIGNVLFVDIKKKNENSDKIHQTRKSTRRDINLIYLGKATNFCLSTIFFPCTCTSYIKSIKIN